MFNQEAGITVIVDAWLRALDKLNRDYELIVIDDGSTDSTREIADGIVVRNSRLKVIRHESRQGIGAALRTGFAAVQYPLVFTVSCEYPYSPGDLKKLLDAIDTAQIVNGCRTDPVPEGLQRFGRIYRGAARVLFGLSLEPRLGWCGWRAWRRAVADRWIYGLRLTDTMSAFKLYRREAIDRIPIQSNGEFVHAELLAKANFKGMLIAEVPIGKLGGTFKGIAEPRNASQAADRRRMFRAPKFLGEPQASRGASAPGLSGG